MSDLDKQSDEELAQLVQAGSLDCFEELVSRYERQIFNFLRYKTPSREDAEDLTQKTFVLAYQRIHQYKPRYKFVTWLFTITRRQAISHYRSRRYHDELDGDLVDARTPAEELSSRDETGYVWALAKAHLSDNQFNVLWLKYKQEMSVREISKAMDKTQAHVKVLLHRGRNALSAAVRQAAMEAGVDLPSVAETRAPRMDRGAMQMVSRPSTQ
jgi:RNA polymerase sigma-70 factor (ECF subfamily)